MIYLIITLVVLLVFLAFTSFAEMSFSSLNRARIKNMAENGNKKAKLVLKLHGRFDEVITTMLICGNGAYIASATVASILFVHLLGESGVVISAITIVVIAVLFADDLPKSMAKHAPERFALLTAPLLAVFITILSPINFLFVKWKRWINKRLSKNSRAADSDIGFRGEELLYVVEDAEKEGIINQEDSFRISNAIELNDLLVEDILTPRVNIVGVSKDLSVKEISRVFMESKHSRLPVYKNSLDKIIGILHIRDFLQCAIDKNKSVEEVMIPVVYASPITPVAELFKQLQQQRKYMAIVTCEYGGTEGLVTMEDILRQFVGEVWDEHDDQEEHFVKISEGKHRISGSADIYKMFEYFGMEEETDSLTVGGWIIENTERIPKKGESFQYKNLTVTITKASPKRVKECLVEENTKDFNPAQTQ